LEIKMKKTLRHHVRHHAKKIYHKTPKFVHGMVVGAFLGIVAVMTLNTLAPVAALSISSPRDCDSNAVINCGALDTAELQKGYKNAGVAAIYSYFGISADDIKNIGATAVAGRAYKNGDVKIGDTLVATGATTAGRENISGSTKVSSGGAVFYTRPPSVSFRVNSIAAYVVMQDGQFKFAIIVSCGNPLTATAVPKQQTPPPVETPKPEVVVTTATSTQTPPSTPSPVVATSTTVLPHTGPSDVLIVGLLAVIGGYLFHATHRHIRRKRRAQG
jgi:hypothetical protein